MEGALIPLVLIPLIAGIFISIGVTKKLMTRWKTISDAQVLLLSNFLPFYNTLCEREKRRFNNRMAMFLEYHDFLGREGLYTDDEMRIAISAAAIHLTFGLDDFLFKGFRDIFIYPSVYYSPFTKSMNRGETNPHGILAFSWPHLRDGFSTTEDRMNLGYHEFAHALLLQESREEYGDSQFERGYQLFSLAMEEFKIARRAYELDFLRPYAFTNKMEFFAVCSEHFLEAPEEMYDKFPGLYNLMCRMLRMDPLTSRFHLHFQYNDDADWTIVAQILNRTEAY